MPAPGGMRPRAPQVSEMCLFVRRRTGCSNSFQTGLPDIGQTAPAQQPWVARQVLTRDATRHVHSPKFPTASCKARRRRSFTVAHHDAVSHPRHAVHDKRVPRRRRGQLRPGEAVWAAGGTAAGDFCVRRTRVSVKAGDTGAGAAAVLPDGGAESPCSEMMRRTRTSKGTASATRRAMSVAFASRAPRM